MNQHEYIDEKDVRQFAEHFREEHKDETDEEFEEWLNA